MSSSGLCSSFVVAVVVFQTSAATIVAATVLVFYCSSSCEGIKKLLQGLKKKKLKIDSQSELKNLFESKYFVSKEKPVVLSISVRKKKKEKSESSGF